MIDLVFEGGGVRGLAFVGAIQQLEQKEFTIRRLVGSSAGAMFAMLVAIGFKSTEMEKLLSDNSFFTHLFDIPTAFDSYTIEQSELMLALKQIDVPGIPEAVEGKIDKLIFKALMKSKAFRLLFSLGECGGLYAGDQLVAWLESALEQKGYQPDVTFKDFPELTVLALDVTKKRRLVLNKHTAPDMPVVWAVRCSMSVPLVWQEVSWKKSWGTYLGSNMFASVLIDGGLITNFGLELLVANPPEMGNFQPTRVIGFLLDEEKPADGVPVSNNPIASLHFVSRLIRTVEAIVSERDQEAIDRWPNLVCRLPCKGVPLLATGYPADRVKALQVAAAVATNEYLSFSDCKN